ncbi:MAG: NAD(P)/FAD-dependent oxidoreductase [Anaerovoracaceae bacterium]|jgi:thioredoxin reductase (NADPH)
MDNITMCDVLIIGKGPAGISAALYAVRAGLSVIVIGKDRGSLGKASKIDNYYGFAEGVDAQELFDNGIKGAERLGVHVVTDEVLEITNLNVVFHVTASHGVYESAACILAAGTSRKTLPIKGLKEYEGKGVSYCAVCDAFFYKNLPVAVIGNGEYAVSEATHLMSVASDVTILTNGLSMVASAPDGVKVNTTPIASIEGGDLLNKVSFQDGSSMNVDGVFVAIGTASSVDLARKLGVVDSEGKIDVDENMATFVPGFFTAGDCNGGLLQVAKAVGEGALAGTSAVKYVRNLKNK